MEPCSIRGGLECLNWTKYQALVRPTLEYCTCVWDPYTQVGGGGGVLKLESVQRRAARYCLYRYHNTSSMTDMLNFLNWKTLEERRTISRLIMLYKILNGVVAITSHPYLQPKLRLSRTHPLSFQPYQTNINAFKYSFFPRKILTWNSSPPQIPQASTVDAFKASINSHTFPK